MAATTYALGIVVALLSLVGGYVYLFGIPPAMKRQMEEKALETMGENKASYMMKDALGKVPASDQKDIQDLNKGLSNAAGGALQNPLGKFTGNTADDLTSGFTGR
ncbi:hypothetical protein LTR08_002528 [Meristemomyces frigidus]|nr:hypothetical protein LTR08_002528 [Meristemomyces frigidus]